MSYKDHPLVQIPLSVVKLPGYVFRRPVLLGVLIVVLILVGAYVAGYRIGPGLTLTKVGEVTLTDLPKGAIVYVNEALHKTAKDSSMRISLLPGTHSILVGTEGLSPEYYPWYELVTVSAGQQTTVHPMLIKKSATETMLHDLDRDRGELLIRETKLPTKEKPLIAHGGCVAVYVESGRLLAAPQSNEGCAVPEFLCSDGVCGTTVVLDPRKTIEPQEFIRTVILFPGRNDAVIVALGKAIYAIEIDSRGPQFVAPILREHLPKVAAWSDNAIVVEEFGAVFTVTFP